MVLCLLWRIFFGFTLLIEHLCYYWSGSNDVLDHETGDLVQWTIKEVGDTLVVLIILDRWYVELPLDGVYEDLLQYVYFLNVLFVRGLENLCWVAISVKKVTVKLICGNDSNKNEPINMKKSLARRSFSNDENSLPQKFIEQFDRIYFWDLWHGLDNFY